MTLLATASVEQLRAELLRREEQEKKRIRENAIELTMRIGFVAYRLAKLGVMWNTDADDFCNERYRQIGDAKIWVAAHRYANAAGFAPYAFAWRYDGNKEICTKSFMESLMCDVTLGQVLDFNRPKPVKRARKAK